jgi:hypothetical protein
MDPAATLAHRACGMHRCDSLPAELREVSAWPGRPLGCLPGQFQYSLMMRVLSVFTRFHATDGIATHMVDLTEALSCAACEVSFLSGMLDFTEETKWKVARLENTCKSFEIDPRLLFKRWERRPAQSEPPYVRHIGRSRRAVWPSVADPTAEAEQHRIYLIH